MKELKIGDKGPGFTANDEEGKPHSLSDWKHERIALYFFSEAGTPTCTIQSCNLRDHYDELKKAGIRVIGISPDQSSKQKKFKEKYQLPFTLLSDPSHTIATAWGVYGMKKMFGRDYMGIIRTTFVVDKGTITHIFNKPKNKEHAAEIMSALQTRQSK